MHSAALHSVTPRGAALFIAAAAALTLAGAWYFELVLRLAPCPLCLDQRIAYYLAVPAALAVALFASRGAVSRETRGALLVLAVVFAFNALLGVYHAGVEWKWWPGPKTCAGAVPLAPASDILSALRQPQPFVACDEAPWRLLGISLAGYNALISAALALVALQASRSRV
jgi:disulfide bond formation protein DsbB